MFDYYASLHAGPRLEATRVAENENRSFAIYHALRSIARPLRRLRDRFADLRREVERRQVMRETAQVLAQLDDRGLADIGVSRGEIWDMSEAASFKLGTSVALIRAQMAGAEKIERVQSGVLVPDHPPVAAIRTESRPQAHGRRRPTRRRSKRSKQSVVSRAAEASLNYRATACCG